MKAPDGGYVLRKLACSSTWTSDGQTDMGKQGEVYSIFSLKEGEGNGSENLCRDRCGKL